MAQSKKSTAKKSGAQPSKAASRAASPARERADAAPPPSRIREILGVLFFFIGIFLLIGFINELGNRENEGAVIAFGNKLIQTLVGTGFWISAPAFLFASVILVFHRNRPVAFRAFCVMMLPVLFGAMWNIREIGPAPDPFVFANEVHRLALMGRNLSSGGVIGGLFGYALYAAFGRLFSGIILLLIFGVFLLVGTRFDLHSAADKIRERAERRAEDEDEPVPAPRTEKPAPKKAASAPDPAPRRGGKSGGAMDIPLGTDEDSLPLREFDDKAPQEEPKRAKVRKKPSVPPIQTISPTERVEPMDLDDAAALAGVALQREPQPAPQPAPTKVRPVVSSTEISDPPRGKKAALKQDVEAEAKAMAEAIDDQAQQNAYVFPPIELLHAGVISGMDYRDEVRLNRERLDNALHSFGINASIVSVTRGPTVTRYDIELEQGVKLSRVTNLAGDLALALGVVNVRIAPIPEKISTVGIEVPNKIVSTVYLRDILDTPVFTNAKSRLSFALGKNIAGEGIVGNIAKLPHLLIAGTTGSGKSVCMNSLILSLLFKARPDEVRLIMIDPKMVELGIYNGIPHLFVPVVTDPKKAAGALQWSVVEMLKRYRLFSEIGVRDLESYNRACEAKGEPTLPQVVIVIDELADLMMVAAKEVEESICRVAQMGRAAGMHLVIATQRPSADVITGLMKANVPSRIAFAVSSAMESRIILDQGGAEKLIGMGDMLFSPVGVGKPMRIQGAFVSDEEREAVVQFIKENASGAQVNPDIEEYMNKAAEDKGTEGGKDAADEGATGDYDEMLPQAVEAVLEAKQCSVSMLQRRVKLGYSRAARIVDQMEELGVVGPYEGAKPRSVIVDRAGWEAIRAQLGLAGGGDFALAESMSADSDENMEY